MEISENNINKALAYIDGLEENAYDNLANKLMEEQAYLSTFLQQNLDYLFSDNEDIKDFASNLHIFILYLFKIKQKNKYPIIDKEKLSAILEQKEHINPYESLGDFIFSQWVSQDFAKEDFLKAIQLQNVIIVALSFYF